MDSYVFLKYIHILCAFVLAGTGAGIAFFMLMASRTKNISVIVNATKHVVLADWIFTAPAVLGQLITGVLLMHRLQYSFMSSWFFAVIGLFIFIGCCWVPVVFIQYHLKNLAMAAEKSGFLDDQFYRWMKQWIALGVPAFLSILMMLWLMVAKPLAIY